MSEPKTLHLGKREARRLFFETRKDRNRIRLRDKHIFKDHPERKWTRAEILQCLCENSGSFEENNQPTAQEASWLWKTEDEAKRLCKFAVQIQEDEDGKIIFVITAIRDY